MTHEHHILWGIFSLILLFALLLLPQKTWSERYIVPADESSQHDAIVHNTMVHNELLEEEFFLYMQSQIPINHKKQSLLELQRNSVSQHLAVNTPSSSSQWCNQHFTPIP